MITDKDKFEERLKNSAIAPQLLLAYAIEAKELIVPFPLVDEPEKVEPKRIKPITFILAGLVVGAVVAIAFGYRFW